MQGGKTMKPRQAHTYLSISPSFIALSLASMIAFLIFIHSAVMVCWSSKACGIAMESINRFGHLFDLSREMNIPTWYSVLQLFAVAFALALAARIQQLKSLPSIAWWGLSAMFLYMSLDEATEMHGLWRTGFEDFAIPGTSHVFFSWIIPATFVVFAVGVIYTRWLFSLPRRTATLFFVAGFIFILGALVFEGIGAFLADETFFNPSYLVVSTIEETLELYGILIMLCAVFDYLQGQGIKVVLAPEPYL